ncbi:hypothetical protein ACI65C_006298 [Semiaphis heraclei]
MILKLITLEITIELNVDDVDVINVEAIDRSVLKQILGEGGNFCQKLYEAINHFDWWNHRDNKSNNNKSRAEKRELSKEHKEVLDGLVVEFWRDLFNSLTTASNLTEFPDNITGLLSQLPSVKGDYDKVDNITAAVIREFEDYLRKIRVGRKHPLLLSCYHRLILLLIDYHYQRLKHLGAASLQANLQRQFWILSVRKIIRSWIRLCIVCYRTRPRSVQPKIASLPSYRVQQVKPFYITGVDYADPRKPMGQELHIGDLVLEKEATHPLCWWTGIREFHPDSDGISRVATLDTTLGPLKRPAVKLCRLPTS